MRKLIYFLMFFLVITGVAFYFTQERDLISSIDDDKIYGIKNQQIVNVKVLGECKFYNKGILTYNDQKFIFTDYNNNVIWENENRVFTDKIYVTDDCIFRCLDGRIEAINKYESYAIAEISGEIISVSREKNKTCVIASQNNGNNSVYLLNENNEIVVENKQFTDLITGISVSDKSEGYCVTELKYTDGKYINKLSFNLLDDLEFWSKTLKNEIIIKTIIIKNNVLAIGTENVYMFGSDGSLMWKNSNYNKIKNFVIDETNEEIFILFESDKKLELLSYNYEGKVKRIYKAPYNVSKIKVYNNRIFLYSKNYIFLLHDDKSDELYYDSNEQITDFYVENNNIFILLKDKLIKGQIS